ncbi:FAD-dependent monooxygenase (plasmid) [Novosphingobium sp. BL-8A]|uniref:FAD-dependent monooxygenase n=1 Tax=Novosphingobium sp. BL-8A TaxID=3127639 RepID=UPI0037582FC1
MACVSKGLIVGAGIGGLASAIALQRIGVQCDVVEIDRRPVGAGIGFAGRAPQALEALGIYDEVYATGKPFTEDMKSPVMRDASGAPLGPPPPPQDFPGSKPPVGVHRPVFAEILARRAVASGAVIHDGMSIVAIEEGTDCVAATLTNGAVEEYDFILGADGISSKTRSLIFPDAPEPEYTGQMSIRWLAPYPAIENEDWYVAGDLGRVGAHNMPLYDHIYVPMVINMPEERLTQQRAYEVVSNLLDQFTAPTVVALRERLTPGAELIARPFKSLLMKPTWYRGRTLLIGDAAHATTAHMGMGGGMALEDAVVLAECIESSSTLMQAYETFMQRRFERVRTVVETSVTLSKLEQTKDRDGPRRAKLMQEGMAVLASPY